METARRDANLTVEQLWLDYLGLGGTLVVFDIEGYLAGLMPMPPAQQDVLACALNEQLTDQHHPARVPNRTNLTDTPRGAELLNALLQELAQPQAGADHDPTGTRPTPTDPAG